MDTPGCTLRSLPSDQAVRAASLAVSLNPVNAPSQVFEVLPAARLALLTSRYWGPKPRRLTVRFLERTPVDLRRRIFTHMNAWYLGGAGVRFVYTTGPADVRITREQDGYWSYLGTDVRQIPEPEPTMCLEGFTMNTSEREYARVVRHEVGHTMGFPHEHMRREIIALIDRERAYAYFGRTQGWSRQDVDQQVLTPLEARRIMSTPEAETTSVMCYQLPGSITTNGLPILGGNDISPQDQAFANQVYPRR